MTSTFAPTRLAAVSTAAVMLPEVSTAQPETVRSELQAARDEVSRCLAATVGDPSVDRVLCVVVCDVSAPRLVTADQLTLAPLGYPHITAAVTAAQLRDEARCLGLRVDQSRVDGAAAVMGFQVVAHTKSPCGFLLLPSDIDVAELDRFADQLAQSASGPRARAIVASSDLSATLTDRSPGYVVPDADRFDREVVAAVEAHDLAALRETSGLRAQYMAYGWPSLYLVARLASTLGQRPADVTYHAPCGVGQVCVTYG